MNLKPFFATFLLSLMLTGDLESKPHAATLKTRAITVEANPIAFDRANPEAVSFGRLRWRGGLVLNSSTKAFGGYSGIALTDKGHRLLAVSDQGTWLSAKLRYKRGKLTGIDKARIGPILAKNGRKLRRKKFADAEEIHIWQRKSGPYALISFERVHRIGRFPLTKTGIDAPKNYIKLPKGVFKAKRNKGLEAMTVLRDKKNKGTVLTFAEKLHDKKGRHKGWLIRGKKHWSIRLTSSDDFQITGLATLPNGNVLILERSFSLLSGVQMRIREVKAKDIKPRAVLDGKVLIHATMRYTIDNMEGISAHQNEAGETIVTLISDDNFNQSGLQKTVLLQFQLDE